MAPDTLSLTQGVLNRLSPANNHSIKGYLFLGLGGMASPGFLEGCNYFENPNFLRLTEFWGEWKVSFQSPVGECGLGMGGAVRGECLYFDLML